MEDGRFGRQTISTMDGNWMVCVGNMMMVGRTVESATPMDARYCPRESGKVSALERRRRAWRMDYSDGF